MEGTGPEAPATVVDSPIPDASPVTDDFSAAPPPNDYEAVPTADEAFDQFFTEFRGRTADGDAAPEDSGEVAQSIAQAEKDAAAWLAQQGQPAPVGGETPAPAPETQPAEPAQPSANVAPPAVPTFDAAAFLPAMTPEEAEQMGIFNPESFRAREVQQMNAVGQMVNQMMLTHFIPMQMQQQAETAYNVVHLAALEMDFGDLIEKAPSVVQKAVMEAKAKNPTMSSRQVLAAAREEISKITKAREQVESGRIDVTKRGRFNNPVRAGKGATRPQGGSPERASSPQERAKQVLAEIAMGG